jgi:hypothetical protein
MASIAIDSTNDVVIENNDLKLITGVDEVAQAFESFAENGFSTREKGSHILKKF